MLHLIHCIFPSVGEQSSRQLGCLQLQLLNSVQLSPKEALVASDNVQIRQGNREVNWLPKITHTVMEEPGRKSRPIHYTILSPKLAIKLKSLISHGQVLKQGTYLCSSANGQHLTSDIS